MTAEQQLALAYLDRAVARFQRAHAALVEATRDLDAAMDDCAWVNDVSVVKR